MLLFIIIVVTLYLLINSYIFLRGWQALEGLRKIRIVYTVVFCIAAGSFLPAFMLKRDFDSVAVEVLWNIASLWLAAMLYLFLTVLLIDLFRLLFRFIGQPIRSWIGNYRSVKHWTFTFVSIGVLLLLSIGYIYATRPRVVEYELTFNADVEKPRLMNVVVVGDLHLGYVYGYDQLQRWVSSINGLSPDLILMVGDVFDDNPQVVERKYLGALLQKMEAPLGRYAVIGNHELMGDLPRSVDYLQRNGVEVLTDQTVLIDSAFYLVGRMDRSVNRVKDYQGLPAERASLRELRADCSDAYPVMVMDHQPSGLDEAMLAGVELQLSGHTHHGQLWPLNYLTEAMFECDRGILRKDAATYIVTSGLGTWGPPVRTGSRSEIVVLHLHLHP